MMKPLIVHMDCGPASTEWAKVAGLCEKTCPGLNLSQGTLIMPDSLTISAYLYTTLPYWPEGSVWYKRVFQKPRLIRLPLLFRWLFSCQTAALSCLRITGPLPSVLR